MHNKLQTWLAVAMLHRATLRIVLCEMTHQDWPAVDAHPGVEGCSQQHKQQQCEEESRAAHKLEGVETETAVAALDQLLQEQGHKGQQLGEHKQKINLSLALPAPGGALTAPHLNFLFDKLQFPVYVLLIL